MKIITSVSPEFNYEQCEQLYKKNSKYMGNTCKFKQIVSNSHFYSFYEGKILLGCIYVNSENDGLFLSGFSVRKNHKKNIEAVNAVLNFYNCPMFAKTKNLTAILLLKKCGFEIYKESEGIKFLRKEK